jgi:predicted NBD/HSP70 family sugar kinase
MQSRDLGSRSWRQAKGADLRAMRTFNRLLVLNCVRQHGPLARVDVARRTSLSRTTVSSIIGALLKEGLVREGNQLDAAPSGGRRAIPLHFNAEAGYVLGVDIGRSHLTILLTNLAAEIIARRSGPFDASLGPAACLPKVVAQLQAFASDQDIGWDRIIGIGIGIPGPVDTRLRMLVRPPRMPGWDHVDICAILRRDLKVPIYLDNDANMGALGESYFGAGRGIADLAYVKLATGIGCGLVINGNIYRGSQGTAGELGHVTIDADGPLCECGNRGCLEAVAGAEAIVQSICLATPDRSARGPDAAPDIADVVQTALDGDLDSRAAIERAGEHIGVALADLINVVNPSIILLDGGVARAGELLLAPIRRAIACRSLTAAAEHTRLRLGELGDNAIALGAVATVIGMAFGAPDALSTPVVAEGGGVVDTFAAS